MRIEATFYTCSQVDRNSVFIMQTWLVQLYYKFTTYRAGLTKHSLPIDNSGIAASFSYAEKGSRNPEKPSIVFVHGLSSNKETWIPIIKNISDDYHCITVDLPGHGETIGFQEDIYTIDKFVEKLKLFFDEMGLTEPMCIIGASMGGAVVCMFAIKYPKYEHKKILTSLLGYDSSLIEDHYQQLRQVNCPALILWGRQDKVYAVSGAEFFCNLLPNSECVVFDDCGHFMAIDKPEETARSILTFFDSNANYQVCC
ncbi:unnamed protein product [Rotaria sordida]|uniref:AB hydrolase-1 domain-containing protein n=1 Tax=Rotaria sordida TaxID=392033 RepID=A0A814YHL8_9BILA|nr:unnamed protein product [Rotaria sordida]